MKPPPGGWYQVIKDERLFSIQEEKIKTFKIFSSFFVSLYFDYNQLFFPLRKLLILSI